MIPMVSQPRTSRKRNAKRLARYQLHPKRVEGVHTASRVACGEAHTLCLLDCGTLLSWGQNSCGQLGTGPTYSGMLCDAFAPVVVAPFVNYEAVSALSLESWTAKSGNSSYSESLRSRVSTKVTDISCGAFHSVCVAADGSCYSWGARGSPCLGHADAELLGDWSTRINGIFSIVTAESKVAVPYELLGWCSGWSMPRLIETLRGVVIDQISCGDLHSSFLSSANRLYLCGSGPVVPGIVSTSSILEDNEAAALQREMEQLNLDKDKPVDSAAVITPRSASLPSRSRMRLACSLYIMTSAAALEVNVINIKAF